MQPFHWIMACLLMPCTVMSQHGYQIDLQLSGFKSTDTFRLVNLTDGRVVDSGTLQNGHLVFRGKVQEPAAARIHTVDNKYLVLYLDNTNIHVEGRYEDFDYCSIRGSAINEAWVRSRDYQRGWSKERDSLIHRYVAVGDDDTATLRGLGKRIQQIDSAVLYYRLWFVRSEPPTYFSMQELFFIHNSIPADTLRDLYHRMPQALKTSRDAMAIDQLLNSVAPEIGSHFTDVKGFDPNGKEHRLSDCKARYTLLEFWASWCGPCRNENPQTLATYKKYHDQGFDIVGFSIDVDKQSWVSAIHHDGLPWLNVSDLGGWYSKAAGAYRVQGVPQNFLIDSRGIIIAKNLRGKDLDDKLKTLLE